MRLIIDSHQHQLVEKKGKGEEDRLHKEIFFAGLECILFGKPNVRTREKNTHPIK